MAIDWWQVKFLAVDGKKSVWTYATDRVWEDIATLRNELPKGLIYQLVPAKRGISMIFHARYSDIAKTIDHIADKIIEDGKATEPD